MASRHLRREAATLKRIPGLDWAMLGLAALSIALLLFDWFGAPDETQLELIRAADLAICACFAAEFLWRWHRVGWDPMYVARNWYDVLGMIPVQQPALRAFRLVRVLILLSRFGMAADRAFGDEFTYRLSSRMKRALVDQISGAVTLSVLAEVEAVMARGTYTRNVAQSLSRNHTVLRDLVLDKMKQDPKTGRLSKIPFYDDIVETVVDACLRVTGELLEDPRANAFVAELLRENIAQLRQALLEHEIEREKQAQGLPNHA